MKDRLIAGAILIILLSPVLADSCYAEVSSSGSGWEQFHNGNEHPGETNDYGPETNRVLWTRDYDYVARSFASDGSDNIFVKTMDTSSGDTYLRKIDGEDGSELWSTSLCNQQGEVIPSHDPSPISEGDNVYVACDDIVYSIDEDNGNIKCQKSLTGTDSNIVGPMATDYDEIFVTIENMAPGGEGALYSVDTDSCSINWYKRATDYGYDGGDYRSGAGVMYDGASLYTVCMGIGAQAVIKSKASDGSLEASHNYTFNQGNTWGPFSRTGDGYDVEPITHVDTPSGGYVILFNDDLTEKMRDSFDGNNGTSLIAGVGSTRWYSVDEDRVIALDANGWDDNVFYTDNNAYIYVSPIYDAAENLYFGDENGVVWAVDESAESEIWSYNTGSEITSSPIILDDMDVLIIANDAGTIYAFGNTPPNAPSNPSPSDGSLTEQTSITLQVSVSDSDGDSMDVTFYDDGDGSTIGTDSGVSSGSTATTTWNVAGGQQYSWYAVADDGTDSTQSSTWSFTSNIDPDAPTNPNPSDHQIISNYGSTTTVNLEVSVSDPNGDSMDVSFYDGGGSSIGTDSGVSSGSTATTSWSVSTGASKSWYAVADDGIGTTQSNTWDFETNWIPDKPTLNSPADGAVLNNKSVTLNVSVNDNDGDLLIVKFFNSTNNLLGLTQGITSGSATLQQNVEYGEHKEWYVTVNDSLETNQSNTFSYETFGVELETPENEEYRTSPVNFTYTPIFAPSVIGKQVALFFSVTTTTEKTWTSDYTEGVYNNSEVVGT